MVINDWSGFNRLVLNIDNSESGSILGDGVACGNGWSKMDGYEICFICLGDEFCLFEFIFNGIGERRRWCCIISDGVNIYCVNLLNAVDINEEELEVDGVFNFNGFIVGLCCGVCILVCLYVSGVVCVFVCFCIFVGGDGVCFIGGFVGFVGVICWFSDIVSGVGVSVGICVLCSSISSKAELIERVIFFGDSFLLMCAVVDFMDFVFLIYLGDLNEFLIDCDIIVDKSYSSSVNTGANLSVIVFLYLSINLSIAATFINDFSANS